MAPEQAMGKTREVGPSADVYALGAILYELLTQKTPFSGSSVMEILEQVRDRPAPPPRRHCPGVPAGLEAICLKCLAKSPADRYPTAAALADDLARFLADQRPAAYQPRRWALWGAGAAAILVGLVVLGWQLPWESWAAALTRPKPAEVAPAGEEHAGAGASERVWVRAETDERKKQAARAMGVLYQYCFECHGAVSKAGNHDVRDIRALTGQTKKRGRFYVVPGDLKKSYLWSVIEDGSMPENEEMPEKQKAIIRKWIEDGAPGWYETRK
jgi:hypothetical protein